MPETNSFDLVSRLSPSDLARANERLRSICPDDGKYASASDELREYLSAEAEWRACARVQLALLETRAEFALAKPENVSEVEEALQRISPVNMSLLESKVTRHDQLAVIEEIGRFVSPETKALLHPGTTSYDILDTARSYLFRQAWANVVMPKLQGVIGQFCELAEENLDVVQVGRTHLQDTSPVLFGGMLAGYAARLAGRAQLADTAFGELRGKISGIVGTGASIDVVIGEGKSVAFEEAVLDKLNLRPDYTATQVVQKERLADAGHALTTLMIVLGEFANDMRLVYSSAIGEVTSRDAKARLGGSSADAGKNNPINYENIAGKARIVQSGMQVLYDMIPSDLQRDLRNSVMARYQPQMMMAEVFESFSRAGRALKQLSVNCDVVEHNLGYLRENPSEALTAITRAHGYVHPELGVGHDAVKEFMKRARRSRRPLVEVALEDGHFKAAFERWPEEHRAIAQGAVEKYVGSARERARRNIEYARRL